MSEQTTPVRTDELTPGDRVWHPFDAVCFTVSHTPRPETGLHFDGDPGLRVTGTDDRGETVHVDVAPGYKWHRGPAVVAPVSTPKTRAPLVVNTRDGAVWTRRAVTEGGVALYALADVCSCPEFVMATFEELAARGIVGSAFALPMPGGPESQADPVAAGRSLDLLALMDERAAAEVSPVLAALLDRAEALRARVAELEAEREKFVRWHGEDSKTITRLVARVDRHRARLVALQNDALSMRGSLAPNGEDRKVPFPLGETLTPAVDWLINRVTELEVAAIEGRAALAALCHDLEDPGSAAFGALFLLQQATPSTPMEPGEPTPTVYRASHDSIVMGLYTTATEARRHCETELRREWPDSLLDWIEDEEDGVAELVAETADGETETGYTVTALEVAASYDEEADE